MNKATETSKSGKKKSAKGRLRPFGKGRPVESQALAEVRAVLDQAPPRRDLLIEYLHSIQDEYGHLSAAHITALADHMSLAPTEVYEVASFYHHFDIVKEGQTPPANLTIRVCESVSCNLQGADPLIEALQSAMGEQVRVQAVPCVGRCADAPVAVVGWNPIAQATVAKIQDAVESKQTDCALPEQTLYLNAYKKQGGYQLYQDCLSGKKTIEQIINQLDDAGLRGLGGAGFPAGRKWRILRDQPKPRLMAVNIDEGEPGTFKDRYYLERDPHRFIEGMLIAAWAVEIDDLYVYVRDEYPAVREIIRKAWDELATEFDLPQLHLRRGAGAYICGEESAMIESIEGKRGMPRLRPPYVAQVGLFGRPTLEHNCETLFWVREIVERGADWFASQGRNGRKGLRSFSVSGRVKKPGVHLAPAGITMNELIKEYCDGMLDGQEFYGYFPGGASGGILPASLGDVPLDFDTLQEYGCFIGSAAIIVLSNKDKARHAATNAMKFFAHESCGQCTPCRVGSDKAAKLMSKPSWDMPLLEDLAKVMEDASICGLGQAAPNPLRCVAKYFPDELK